MTTEKEKEIVEPEVLPPKDGPNAAGADDVAATLRPQRLKQALVTGLLLDAIDIYSFVPGPAALVRAGVGAVLGLYAVRTQDVPRNQRTWWVSLCALYCAAPRTHFFPLATLILVYRALRRN